MFFLLRMAFWLSVVCIFLPSSKEPASVQIGASEAVSAAGATLSDMRSFCERQPDACEVGGKVAVALGHRAQEGAKTLFGFIREKLAERDAPNQKSVPLAAGQNTLTPSDLAPAWHAPLPLPAPRREAENRRPSA